MFFDGTGKDGKDFVTCSILVENKITREVSTICLRAAFMSDNKTAASESQAIQERVFLRGQGLLEGWISKFQELFPGEKCAIPEPENCRLARRAGGAALMSDGCNQALAMQRMVADLIKEDFIRSLGVGAEGRAKWDNMSETERNESVRVYNVTCQNHLRNTFIRHGSCLQKIHANSIATHIHIFFRSEV